LNVLQNFTRLISKIDSKLVLFTISFLLISSLFTGFSPIHIWSLTSSKENTGHATSIPEAVKPINGEKSHQNISIIDLKSSSNSGIVNGRYNIDTNNKTDKVVILTFGDTRKSQFTNAKPILDQYGFKAGFFITCSYANDRSRYHLNWTDILTLQKDGQDIESKGMTPTDLNNLSPSALIYQITGSKQCLESHGIKSPNWFAPKYGDVWDNATVINAISKDYQFADDGNADLMFLHCDGYTRYSSQTDCRTYFDNGTLTFANSYSIREWSHNRLDDSYLHNDTIIFQKFIQEVNSGINFNNKKGMVDAIPVVAYHIVDNSLDPSSTDINLFASEMKYLHDNGFRVIPVSALGYNQTTNFIYIRQ
jgi:peptidoglycan/xylan/chitin deacetylase (PgdA/CDA1 family)